MLGRGKRGAAWLARTLICMAPLVAPAHALALDSDLKGSAIFKVEASNGYSLLGFAASERLDGRTEMGLIVSNRRSSVNYVVPAVVTPTRVEADMGALGRISLAVEPSGVKRTVRSRCGEDSVTVEPNVYRGTLEFHGEEEYTEASATTLPEYTRFLLDVLCLGAGRGGISGPDVPGAQLKIWRGKGNDRAHLQVNKNRPSGRTRIEVNVDEKRGRIEISRSTTVWAGPDAFRYDPMLRTATLAPPAPFSGSAAFHRDATRANRWIGSLTVDLPGRSDIPLALTHTRAALIPFCRHEGAGAFRC